MEKKRSPLLAFNAKLPMVIVLLLFAFMANEADAQVFCRSQFNLANEACSLRSFPGANPALPRRLLNASSSAGYELQSARDEHGGSGHGSEHGREHSREHGSDHGSGDHGGSHHHGHHGHVGGADPYDTACCRRLMGIDNACICQAMSFLPVFMSRVKHAIKLTPVPGCDISFECAAVN
ncbi:uncharacterized protein LOC124656664 [Lolium rigidum]|uniref:uncharacterized protein LOC124656664 n=1 Tax=Lolium rigidum TaxID=89674 RepID=UPI001F5D4A62|nr:uncharacterized protein LOC124656664 [Lolium rigidum]